MSGVPTVKVQHPDNPDDYMIINESDFDAKVHKPFEEKDGSSDDLPAGYEAKHAGGGRWKAFVDGEPLKYADGHEKAGGPAIFASKDEAVAALKVYAETDE